MCKQPLIILTGPTAVGKTSLSIKLAKKIGAQIISADSMQVYRHMDIGTAKITSSEMQGVKHYLIDEIEPTEEFNVTIFKEKALKAIEQIRNDGYIPMIVGGTGFYIRALLYDIEFEDNDADTSYRQELYQLEKEKGAVYLYEILKNVDPKSAESIHYRNVKRVVRALEYYKQTGNRISEHNEEQRKKDSPYNYKYFVLNDIRDNLYERINKRVDIMFDDGLIDEMQFLTKMGIGRDNTSMQGIGYKEILDYWDNLGKPYGSTIDENGIALLKEQIKGDTRHFAKRQLTWFRREKVIDWININEYDYDCVKIMDYMLDKLKDSGIIK